MKSRFGLMLVAGAVLAGCGGKATYNVYVPDQWGKAIARFGLTPLYPPREDVLPGDVFMIDLSDKRHNVEGVDWLTRIAGVDRVEEYLHEGYSNRPLIQHRPIKAAGVKPAASGTKGSSASSAAAGTDTPGTEDARETDLQASRTSKTPRVTLRNLAVPSLDVGRVLIANVSGSFHSSGIDFGAAFGGSSDTAVHVALDQLKSLHVDRARFLAIQDKETAKFASEMVNPEIFVRLLAERSRPLARSACEGKLGDLERAPLEFVIVNEVVYAHAINYTYSASHQLAASLKAAISVPTASTQAGTAGGSDTSTTGKDTTATATGGTEPKGKPEPKAKPALADSINALSARIVGGTPAPGTPGSASASFGIGSTGELTMRKTWDRPLAIGFAGSTRYNAADMVRFYAVIAAGGGSLSPMQRIEFDTSIRELMGTCYVFGNDGTGIVNYLTGKTRQ